MRESDETLGARSLLVSYVVFGLLDLRHAWYRLYSVITRLGAMNLQKPLVTFRLSRGLVVVLILLATFVRGSRLVFDVLMSVVTGLPLHRSSSEVQVLPLEQCRTVLTWVLVRVALFSVVSMMSAMQGFPTESVEQNEWLVRQDMAAFARALSTRKFMLRLFDLTVWTVVPRLVSPVVGMAVFRILMGEFLLVRDVRGPRSLLEK